MDNKDNSALAGLTISETDFRCVAEAHGVSIETVKAIFREHADFAQTYLAAQAEQSQSAGSARQGGITSLEGLTRYGIHNGALVRGRGDLLMAEDVERFFVAAIASQSQAAQPTDDYQWAFELAADHEARGKGLYGPVTFTATGLVNFVKGVAAHIAGTSQATKLGCEGTGKFGDMPCLGCDACPEFSQATKAQAEPVARITFAHEVDGPWRLELNGVTISRHEARDGLDQAIKDLRVALAAPVAKGAEKEQQALRKLCDQIDSEKRRLRPTPGTGQNHSYLLAEDVDAYVEEARKSLAPTTQQAAKAESEGEQAHVMPPTRGTGGQRDAGVAHGDIVAAYTRWMHDSSQFPHSDDTRHPFEAFSAGVKAACRFRAQGGNTNTNDSNSVATPTTSTVSAPPRIVTNPDGSSSTYITEYENDLETDLAAIRDLFPLPDSGELHNLWSEACSDPRSVVAYVKAQVGTEGAKAAPEDVRNQALTDAEDAARSVMDAADEASESAESIGAFRCINAIQYLRTSTDQANADTGSAE